MKKNSLAVTASHRVPIFSPCALATYEAIYKIDGGAAATVDYKEGRVTALIDSSKTTQPALEDALKKREIKLKTPTNNP